MAAEKGRSVLGNREGIGMSDTAIEIIKLFFTILPYVGFCVFIVMATNPDSGSGRITLRKFIWLVLAMMCLLKAISDGVMI